MNRRTFIKSTGLAAAAPLILPTTRLFGADAPSNKLNIALIGVYGRGNAHWNSLSTQNVVALCDVNEKHLDLAAAKFPSAKHYLIGANVSTTRASTPSWFARSTTRTPSSATGR